MPDPLEPLEQKHAVADVEARLSSGSELNNYLLAPSMSGRHYEPAAGPTEFDGFELQETLGDGGSATVYKATNQKTGETVAIKVFKQTSSKSSSPLGKEADALNTAQMKRFEKELSTLRKLDCSNIVGVSGWGTTPDGAPYIVMQYVSGKSIKRILDDGEVFPADRTISIAREICRALKTAHTQEFIHRDLKPSNIIVNDKNDTKVVDFGIAKAMGIGIIDDTITQLGAVVGSPAYMSPEQCLGEPLDARSDIYSLGCTMYEMLTGCKAFASETTVQAIAKQINPDRSNVRKYLHSTGVSSALESVIMKCLEREPINRYQSVGELDHDLSALQLNKPISTDSSNALPTHPSSLIIGLTATAMSVVLIGVIVLWNIRVAPPPSVIYRSSISHYSAPVYGVQIFNKSGKMIFDDPLALGIKQAVLDAVKEKVDLREVKLQSADLRGINLIGVDLSGADLSSSTLSQSHLTDVNLRGANLTSANLQQSNFLKVDLSRADMGNANLTQCRAPDCNISGANLSFARLTQAEFDQGICSGAIFKSASMVQTGFKNANLKFANFDNAHLTGTSFAGADLSGATFANTRPIQVRVLGANLAGTFLPNIEIRGNGAYMTRMR